MQRTPFFWKWNSAFKQKILLLDKYEENGQKDHWENVANNIHVYLEKGQEVEIGLKNELHLCFDRAHRVTPWERCVVVLCWALVELGTWGEPTQPDYPVWYVCGEASLWGLFWKMWLVQGYQLLVQRVCYCYALCQSACPFVASLPCLTAECLYAVASTDLQMAFRQCRQMHSNNKWRVSVKSSYVCPSCFLQMLPDVPLPTHHVQKRAVLGSINQEISDEDRQPILSAQLLVLTVSAKHLTL